VLFNLAHALALSMFAAFAVDLGFGAAFVDDVVGISITVYFGILVSLLVGRRGAPHPSKRIPVRVPAAALLGLLIAWSLRGWAMVQLPVGQYTTTGHSPYVALSICALLIVGSFDLLSRIGVTAPSERPSASPQVDAPADGASTGSSP